MKTTIRSSGSPRHRRLTELLVQARTRAGLTQAQLADRLGRPQSWVSKYEGGERRLDVVEFLEVVETIGVDAAVILSQVGRVAGGGR